VKAKAAADTSLQTQDLRAKERLNRQTRFTHTNPPPQTGPIASSALQAQDGVGSSF